MTNNTITLRFPARFHNTDMQRPSGKVLHVSAEGLLAVADDREDIVGFLNMGAVVVDTAAQERIAALEGKVASLADQVAALTAVSD